MFKSVAGLISLGPLLVCGLAPMLSVRVPTCAHYTPACTNWECLRSRRSKKVAHRGVASPGGGSGNGPCSALWEISSRWPSSARSDRQARLMILQVSQPVRQSQPEQAMMAHNRSLSGEGSNDPRSDLCPWRLVKQRPPPPRTATFSSPTRVFFPAM